MSKHERNEEKEDAKESQGIARNHQLHGATADRSVVRHSVANKMSNETRSHWAPIILKLKAPPSAHSDSVHSLSADRF